MISNNTVETVLNYLSTKLKYNIQKIESNQMKTFYSKRNRNKNRTTYFNIRDKTKFLTFYR